MKPIFKRAESLLLCAALLLGLAACGSATAKDVRLSKSTVRKDVQAYIQETVGSDVELTECEQEREQVSDKEIEVTCEVEFTGDTSGEGTFLLTYILEDDEWELDDCVAEQLSSSGDDRDTAASAPAAPAPDEAAAPALEVPEEAPAEGPVAVPPSGGSAAPAAVTETYGTVEYPLTDVEIEVLYPECLDGYLSGMLAYSQKETGVEMEYRVLDVKTYEERLNLTLASGDYPDVFLCFYSIYSEEQGLDLTMAIEDEVLIDPSEYLREYAPDFMKLCADEDGKLPEDFFVNDMMPCFPTVDAEGNKIGGAYDTYRVGLYISTGCDDIPAAVQWCNWWYTDQAAGYGSSILGRSNVSSSELQGALAGLG